MAALADFCDFVSLDAKKSGTDVPDFVIGGLKKPSEWGVSRLETVRKPEAWREFCPLGRLKY